MTRFRRSLSRRAFVSLGSQLLTFISCFRIVRFTGAVINTTPFPAVRDDVDTQEISQIRPYGAGTYGQGRYPGFRVYVASVKKEGK